MTMTPKIEQLEVALGEALDKAHNAPRATYHVDHDGHRWVEGSDAWARHSNEAFRIWDELDRLKAEIGD